jgi:bacteriocin-like protein
MNDMNDLKDIDENELDQIEGGYYGPCGCIPFPLPYPECPPANDPL